MPAALLRASAEVDLGNLIVALAENLQSLTNLRFVLLIGVGDIALIVLFTALTEIGVAEVSGLIGEGAVVIQLVLFMGAVISVLFRCTLTVPVKG